MDDMGQHSRKGNFKIVCVKVTEGEDVQQIVCDINMNLDDISVAPILHTRDDAIDADGNKSVPSIICHIEDQKIKSAIMTAKRKHL